MTISESGQEYKHVMCENVVGGRDLQCHHKGQGSSPQVLDLLPNSLERVLPNNGYYHQEAGTFSDQV